MKHGLCCQDELFVAQLHKSQLLQGLMEEDEEDEVETYSVGKRIGGAPLLWNTPSTNTPFLPRQRR